MGRGGGREGGKEVVAREGEAEADGAGDDAGMHDRWMERDSDGFEDGDGYLVIEISC